MAIKTFTTGEVLTAADTNTYLANSGLVYVASQTVGTAVSSVTVSAVFSSTYDNYRIIVTDVVPTGSGQFNTTLSGITTLYDYQLIYGTYAGTVSTIGNSSQSVWAYSTGLASTVKNSADIEIWSPFLTSWKRIRALYVDSGAAGQMTGLNRNAVSATGFTLTLTTGTMTGGTITVYGYRKA
jgi:hypothetical protein